MSHLSRRAFLKRSAAVAGGLVVAPHVLADSGAKAAGFDISLAQWSLHKAFFGRAGVEKKDPLRFAEISKTEFGITAVEYVNQFYKDQKSDDGYLKELKKVADDAGVKSVLIMCDGEGALGDADEGKRKQAVDNHKRWVEWAKFLGCHSIRVNAQSSGSYDEQLGRAADGLRKLTEFSATHQIATIVENHGGLSSNGAWLAAVMKKVDHTMCGTLPDFGNFRVSKDEEYDRYKGVDELMPYAKGVSAKSHDFDEKGNETHTDYRKMLDIVLKKHKYTGYIGIEYEGGKVPEAEGIKLTKKLLESLRGDKKEPTPVKE